MAYLRLPVTYIQDLPCSAYGSVVLVSDSAALDLGSTYETRQLDYIAYLNRVRRIVLEEGFMGTE